MLKVAICDDEKSIRETLKKYIQRLAEEKQIEFETVEYTDANLLLEKYPKNIDLLLLDIFMPGVDGMAAAGEIRKFDPDVCIIFITTMFQRAIEGYAVRAFSFIKKPLSYEDFKHEMISALRQIQYKRANEDSVVLCSGQSVYRFTVGKITYVEVRGHNIIVNLGGEVQAIRGSMKEICDLLMPYGFSRCHASFLVNSKYIKTVDINSLTLSDGTVLPVSQRRRREFMHEILSFLGGTQ